MACTLVDWFRWLPAALDVTAEKLTVGAVQVGVGSGVLDLTWQTGALRVIGQVQLPRLLVHFCFSGVDEAERLRFMRRFDLYMLRGGG